MVMNAEYTHRSIEKDPYGWVVEAVPDTDKEHMRQMEDSGRWVSYGVDRTLEEMSRKIDSRVVIVGRMTDRESPYVRLFNDLDNQARGSRGDDEISDASEPNPGLVVTFVDIPTPQEIQDCLARNSTQAGYMKNWSPDGRVAYASLYPSSSGLVEYGTMDLVTSTRTHAMRSFADSGHHH